MREKYKNEKKIFLREEEEGLEIFKFVRMMGDML